MKIIDWLKQGDPVIADHTDRDLLDMPVRVREEGLLRRYLDLYDPACSGWGAGLYSPKWISDHYTLIELKDMGIRRDHPAYRASVENLLRCMWYKGRPKIGRKREYDMCMAAMLLDLCVYGGIVDPRMEEIVDYILAHPMADGGWNCSWDSPKRPKKSSLHTTISVLEAFRDYRRFGYSYRLDEIAAVIPPAEEFIFRKRFFRSVRTGEIIHSEMLEFHYPPRWKYDAFRGLDYFRSVDHPYDPRMDETMDILRTRIRRGYILRGSPISGLIRMPLETTKGGRFNTLCAMRILRRYDPGFYHELCSVDFASLDA
ncbi:MAG: hypothetical protein Q8N15_01430 [Bacillota bacterium]|nr:hypothetical protein [Bacillota bacterium]